jgi:histidinol-phosphate aminotransferase
MTFDAASSTVPAAAGTPIARPAGDAQTLGGQIVVGIGARRGVAVGDVRVALGECLAAAGFRARDVVAIVTVDAKQSERALQELARLLGVPLHTLPADRLARQLVPNPSAAVDRSIGTPSVAEAAVLAAGAELILPKYLSSGVTVAVGRLPSAAASTGSIDRIDLDDIPSASEDLTHHGDAEMAPGLVDLAVNVRGAAPPWLRDRLRDAVDRLAAYPNPREATAAVAARHGRPPEQVLLTAGAAEAFVLLSRVLTPRRAIVVHPQFTGPEAALRAAGHSVHRVMLQPPFVLAEGLVPEDADLVIVGNPTNPTSVLHPAEALMALARPGRVLVVDEAFMDAVPGESESLAGSPDRPAAAVPGLVVVRSLTKTWGLAGLRVGYLLGDAELLQACEAAQPLWSVGSMALEAAIACSTARAVAEAEQIAEQAVGEREHLLDALAGLTEPAGQDASGPDSGDPSASPPVVVIAAPPQAPFVLLKVLGPDPAGVHERLRDAGWAVRRADTFPGLGPGWLRAAIRDRATSEAFVVALARAVRAGSVDTAGVTEKSS